MEGIVSKQKKCCTPKFALERPSVSRARQPSMPQPTSVSAAMGPTASWYCRSEWLFCNKCDRPFLYALVRAALAATRGEKQQLNVFVVGVHDGSDIGNLIVQPWYNYTERVKIYGWELSWDNFRAAQQRLKQIESIELIRRAVSNFTGTTTAFVTSSRSETHSMVGCSTSDLSNTTHSMCAGKHAVPMPVQAWSDFLVERSVPEVLYALIDVEGHEVSVLRGMHLERNTAAFPMFQFELGGTWSDERHNGDWSMYETAQYLEALGYRIYLIGARHHRGRYMESLAKPERYRPLLLPFNSTPFRNTRLPHLHPGNGVLRSLGLRPRNDRHSKAPLPRGARVLDLPHACWAVARGARRPRAAPCVHVVGRCLPDLSRIPK